VCLFVPTFQNLNFLDRFLTNFGVDIYIKISLANLISVLIGTLYETEMRNVDFLKSV
jgi:hypothetical protein